ncbi:MAG TPA: hypothetical protein ENH91_15925 [Leeuwenhoekiella sp.]|nr:hypothetical protein [Leeuwenhoekiella sp.]
MSRFELKIWDDECERCTFYSVLQEDADHMETDYFLMRYENNPIYTEALQTLVTFIIEAMGNRHGALNAFFNRHENEVDGFPAQGKIKLGTFDYHYPNFPLRLYALRITENIVILFNGGIKDGPTNQTSSLHAQWKEACSYAQQITRAIQDGTILVNEENRILNSFDGGNDIIL